MYTRAEGNATEEGSGAAEGTKTSSSEVEVAGSLCSGIVIDESSGVTKGMKPSSSSDIEHL